MILRVLIYFLFLFIPWLQLEAMGPSPNISSLQNDSLLTLRYLNNSRAFLNSNIDSSIYYAKRSLEAANHHGNEYLKALALDQFGLTLTQRGDWSKAVKTLHKALHIKVHNNWPTEVGKSRVHIGNLYFQEGEIQEFNEEHSSAEQSFKLALSNYLKANEIFSTSGDSLWHAKTISNIATIHYKLYEDQKALKFYLKSMELLETLNANELIPGIMTNLAVIYESKGDIDSAIYYYKASQRAFLAQKDLQGLVNCNINLASLLSEREPKIAINLLLAADSLALQLGKPSTSALVQKKLYQIYTASHQFEEALRHLEKYQAIKDSLLTVDFKTEELNIRYHTAEQQEQIEKHKAENLRKELELTKAESEKRQLITISAIVLLVLGAGFTFYLWRQRTKSIIQKQKDELLQFQIEDLERSKKLEAANAMLAGQEKERIRVAEDLHDKLGSTLVAARMQFEIGLGESLDENPRFSKGQKLLNTAIQDTRNISHNLISGVLVNLGLVPALKDLKDSLEVAGQLEVELSYDDIPELNDELELQLFRITQELTNNAVRHANANKLEISLKLNHPFLVLSVADNGSGFDPHNVNKGIGLHTIERRIASLNGKLHFQSSREKGSRFTIKVKYNHGEFKNIAG